MIKSIRHKGLSRFASRGDASQLPTANSARLRRILIALDAAARPEDMRIPGFRFHALRGDKQGRYAVAISGNWRLTFGWEGGAVDVDLEDYH